MEFSKKDKQGFVFIGIAVVFLTVFAAVKISIGDPKKADEFGCISSVSKNTVIVIDHSEQMTEQTRAELVARALRYVNEITETNERVSVFNISEVSKKSLTPSFSMCKPKREGNRLTAGVASMEKRFKKKFIDPLTNALNVQPGNSKESPLAQSLIDISLTQYLRGDKNSVLVFSDMLEHVPGKFSMYPPQACRDQASTVRQFRESRNGAIERPTFKNTFVQLNIVPRTDVPRSVISCRDQLWTWFFGDNEGAAVGVSLDFLPGH